MVPETAAVWYACTCGGAQVADFGLSRVMDVMGETLPLEQQGFGALTHAAPELLSGQPLCAACDVFSVGVLLWELLVGQVRGVDVGNATVHGHGFARWKHVVKQFITTMLLSSLLLVLCCLVYASFACLTPPPLLLHLPCVPPQAAFAGIHPGEVLSLKLHHDPSHLLPFPLGTPPALVLLAQSCWAQDPSQRPPMTSVVSQLNAIALDLLGVEWCLGMFPDVARLVSSRRCQAAATLSHGLAGGGYASW